MIKDITHYIDKIFSISNAWLFNELAVEIFHYQYLNNSIYRNFVDLLKIKPEKVKSIDDIPFLPVEFFKTHQIITGNNKIQQIFLSSGTTGTEQSRHYITDISIYESSFRKGFHYFYGNPEQYCFLALLPSYLERQNSSLIYMVEDLIKQSNHKDSGFYLHNTDELIEKLLELDQAGQKVMLLGVSYALMDIVEKHPVKLKNTIVMETGGMKGKRKEMVREELHAILCKGFGVDVIHSEYGMTELLSQAYSKGNGIFQCPPRMKVLIRDTNDPFSFIGNSKTGGINIIDLANINSCCFISTQDLGKTTENECFEVLGRFDNSDLRGCNLMIG